MPKHVKNLLGRAGLWLLRQSDATVVDGIRIVDMRNRGDAFQHTIEQALRLIREHDMRRHRRVTRHISWIVNHVTPGKAIEYNHGIGLCTVEFFEVPDLSLDVLAAAYACFIVHEATHAVIAARGIAYTVQQRARIERLCTVEHNRFATRLAAVDVTRYPMELLRWDFDERQW